MKTNLKVLLLIPGIALGIVCCKQMKSYKMKINLTRLTSDNIYDKKLVSDVIFDAQELHIDSLKNKSSKLFLQGLDLYKNKKNPDSAVALFKQSLLVFPEDITYYELGDALMDAKNGDQKSKLHEALQAYEVAENLHFQPAAQIYYDMACADNMLGSDTAKTDVALSWHFNQATFNLRRAFMSGFNDTAMLEKDERLKGIMKTDAYKNMLAELKAQKHSDKPESFFELYKKSYPVISQPFMVSLDKVEMPNNKDAISFDYARFIPEMENTEFGRDVSHDYYYVGRFEDTPLYSAVIYTSTEFYGVMEPVYTKLVTYTPEGNIIDSRVIACSCSPEKAKTVRIENNIIYTEDFKRTWKRPITSEDNEDYGEGQNNADSNYVVKSESISKEVFKLTEIGKIVEAGDTTKVALK